jgi:glycerol-3-phosphate dehydrogenase
MTRFENSSQPYDLAVIGGGINGAGIAADAAGRGLRVVLFESNDFASGTSSASSKLLHGGLRYLEQREFRLVRAALAEREVLLRKAPHLVKPLRFVLPVVLGMRPVWMLRLGLVLYDTLASRISLPKTESIRLSKFPDRKGFRDNLDKAFVYSDCWTDDARLVVANVLTAQSHGASIRDRTKCTSAEREGSVWRLKIEDTLIGGSGTIYARALVNAAGPWTEAVAESLGLLERDFRIRKVKGSHIVVPKLWNGDHAALLQLRDGRVLVIVPFEDDYTLVGTTDIEYEGQARDITISEDETAYLLKAINEYFQHQTHERDIVWSFAGVRPLFESIAESDDNPSTVSRDYAFRLDDKDGTAPMLTVLGGKLTTYRELADHALRELSRFFPDMGPGKTSTEPLAGGDLKGADLKTYHARILNDYPFLAAATVRRLTRLYGSRVEELLFGARSAADLGAVLGADLTEAELNFLVRTEWVHEVDDLIWRRTKLGLKLSDTEKAVVAAAVQRANLEARRSHVG